MLQVKKHSQTNSSQNSKFPPSNGNLPKFTILKISSPWKNLENIKVPVNLQDKV